MIFHLLFSLFFFWGNTSVHTANRANIVDLTITENTKKLQRQFNKLIQQNETTLPRLNLLKKYDGGKTSTPQALDNHKPSDSSAPDKNNDADSNHTISSDSTYNDNNNVTFARMNELTALPKLKKEIKANYPLEAKKAQIEGPVILDVVIDKNGNVHDAKVINGPGYGLNESAIEAIKKFEFSPAFKNDQPVFVKIRYTYRFKLDYN